MLHTSGWWSNSSAERVSDNYNSQLLTTIPELLSYEPILVGTDF